MLSLFTCWAQVEVYVAGSEQALLFGYDVNVREIK